MIVFFKNSLIPTRIKYNNKITLETLDLHRTIKHFKNIQKTNKKYFKKLKDNILKTLGITYENILLIYEDTEYDMITEYDLDCLNDVEIL